MKHSGWRGSGSPMQVGIGKTSREVCDGQGLCSTGRWAPADRRYPTGSRWEPVAKLFMDFARSHGTTDLLTRLALGQVPSSPFVREKIAEPKSKIIDYLSTQGIHLQRATEDRSDLPVDYRFLHLLLSASDDPEVGLGEFSRGVRSGTGEPDFHVFQRSMLRRKDGGCRARRTPLIISSRLDGLEQKGP